MAHSLRFFAPEEPRDKLCLRNIVPGIFSLHHRELRVDLVALLVMAMLLISAIVTPAEGLSGFSDTATVTVAGMFVLSAGLFKTGAVNFLGSFVSELFKGRVAILVVMVVVGVLSAFINNTPVIAIFLPVLLGIAPRLSG